MQQIRRSDGQIVLPMFSTDEKVGLTTATGSMIYNIDTNNIEYYNGSNWKELLKIDKKYTFDIIEHSYTDMDDFILRVEIDICSRSFSLLSENGDSRLIKCDTKEEFIRILRVCDELLLPDQVVYKELATQKDK